MFSGKGEIVLFFWFFISLKCRLFVGFFWVKDILVVVVVYFIFIDIFRVF